MNKFAIALVVTVVGLFFAWHPIWLYSTSEVVEVKIVKTDRECTSTGGTCRYMVYTDNEVFTNIDEFWFFKFNSSDVNNKLLPLTGQTAKIKVSGMRFSWFSWYRNVISVQ